MKKFAFALPALLLPFCALTADFDVKDQAAFARVVPEGAKLEKLGSGMGFLEGPAWDQRGFLVFSDIPNDEIKKWSADGGVSTFRKPSQNANGNTFDAKGILYTAEHSGRRISVTDQSGNVSTLVDKYDGKKFSSPNDVVVRSDGTVWFTDPDYGLGKNTKEQEGNYVYRFDPKAKQVEAVIKDFDKPNGLCFSPNEERLFVADSGKPHHIRMFNVTKPGPATGGAVFCVIDKGGPDGIRCDNAGRIWSSAGDGVHVFDQAGKLIGKILVPETPANLCFGGKEGKTLFITARKSLYSIQTSVTAPRTPH
jgi:gluconolactonase